MNGDHGQSNQNGEVVGASFALSPAQLKGMRTYRLDRFRAELAKDDIALAILCNPTSTRYVADVWSFPVFQARVPATYLAVFASGPVISFGGFFDEEPEEGGIVSEIRPGRDTNTLLGGFDIEAEAEAMATDIADLLREFEAENQNVAIENMSPLVTMALLKQGLTVSDAQLPIDRAKLIKCEAEIQCMRRAIAVAEAGIAKLKADLRPGLSERTLWSNLFQVAMANSAEWFDSRQLTSGPQTYPPGGEATDRLVEDGDLVAFDTDMIGPLGYCADISRTLHCGPSKPTSTQREVYRLAYDQLMHNTALFRPGTSFHEIMGNAFPCPEGYSFTLHCVAHGLGMCDEYPLLTDTNPKVDGVLEPGMVMCVEAYATKEGVAEGVRLEEQIVIRDDGYEVLTTYPFEEELLA